MKWLAMSIFTAAVAVGTFYFYEAADNKKQIDYLKEDESFIINNYGKAADLISFHTYPKGASRSKIDWVKDKPPTGNKAIKVTFRDSRVGECVGIYLTFTVQLGKYLEEGILQFWIKGGEESSFINRLDVYLKEFTNGQQMVKASLPVALSNDWQCVSLPINYFQLGGKRGIQDEEFSWGIIEIIFSVNYFGPDKIGEILMGGLRVMNGGRVIYDIF